MKERQRQNTTRFDFSCADFASNDWGTNVVVLSKFAVFQVCCSDIDDFSFKVLQSVITSIDIIISSRNIFTVRSKWNVLYSAEMCDCNHSFFV